MVTVDDIKGPTGLPLEAILNENHWGNLGIDLQHRLSKNQFKAIVWESILVLHISQKMLVYQLKRTIF